MKHSIFSPSFELRMIPGMLGWLLDAPNQKHRAKGIAKMQAKLAEYHAISNEVMEHYAGKGKHHNPTTARACAHAASILATFSGTNPLPLKVALGDLLKRRSFQLQIERTIAGLSSAIDAMDLPPAPARSPRTPTEPTRQVSKAYAAEQWFLVDIRILGQMIASGAIAAAQRSPKKWIFDIGDVAEHNPHAVGDADPAKYQRPPAKRK